MVSVRCPWCDRRLEAADGDILSGALTMHFHRDHGLNLPDSELLRGGRESPLSSLAEADGEGPEAEARRGSEAYGGRMTERGSDLYGVTGPPHVIGVRKEAEQPFVECPLCGFEARGADEEELSRNLKEHMRGNNELPPERS